MTAHLFGGYGMMPFNIQTDPGLPNFMQRAKVMIPGLVLPEDQPGYLTGGFSVLKQPWISPTQ